MFCHAQSHVNPPLISKCSAPKPEKETSLYKAFEKRNREFIGTALTIRNETAEPQIVAQDFNSVTPENAMKWESTEPSRNNFTFAGGDAVVAFAKKYDTEIHCHTLVWHSQLPTWVSGGGFDNKTLISIMENHIKNVAGRWKGACTRWDVVNEALNEDGTYRKSVFLDTIGEAYIPIAFRLAAKYAKGSKLYYNDYNLEYNGAKTEGAKRIVKLIKSYGVRIDGECSPIQFPLYNLLPPASHPVNPTTISYKHTNTPRRRLPSPPLLRSHPYRPGPHPRPKDARSRARSDLQGRRRRGLHRDRRAHEHPRDS